MFDYGCLVGYLPLIVYCVGYSVISCLGYLWFTLYWFVVLVIWMVFDVFVVFDLFVYLKMLFLNCLIVFALSVSCTYVCLLLLLRLFGFSVEYFVF